MVKKNNSRVSKNGYKYSLDIRNVTKVFNRKTFRKGGYTTLKSLLLNPLKHEKSTNNSCIYAIKDLTLQIPKGKSVGIIGRNGAGKSTLLKLISGIYQPTEGEVKVNGKIAALIELGAGFHPDFTGRENIYLGGAMHGMTRDEIDKVYDDIVKFSELEDFIDAPIRTYSSGMFMRLGFSLAIHTSPDILIVDEVLAVGDASFNSKCKDRLFDIKKRGTTLLLVSHDLSSIKEWCDEAIWIEKGMVKDKGIPEKIIDEYLNYVNIHDGEKIKELNKESLDVNEKNPENEDLNCVAKNLLTNNSDDDANKLFSVKNIICLDKNNNECYAFKANEKLILSLEYKGRGGFVEPVFEIRICRSDGLLICEANSKIDNAKLKNLNGTLRFEITDLDLIPARYKISIAVKGNDGTFYYFNDNAVNFLVRSVGLKSGAVFLKHKWDFF